MPRNWEKEDNMKKVFVLISGITFLFICFAVAQNVADFESSQHDVVANGAYQAATPFFPGVIIETIDSSGNITGWPIVVRAYNNGGTCITLPNPGTVGGFDSVWCSGLRNDTRNYPVNSGYNSLSDTAEPPVDGPRRQDGFLISFDYPVRDISVGFADWGDYFPNSDKIETFPSYIKLIAYDGNGTSVATVEGPHLNEVDSTRDAARSNGKINLGLIASNIREVEVRFMGKIDPGVTIDDITFTGELNVDIKPGSDPNCFNSNSHGVIPVAILGSEDFDVSIIDPFSVSLDGQGVRVKGKSGNAGSLEDVNGDLFADLVIQIENDGSYSVGDSIGIITATSYDWYGNITFIGQDSICITQD